MSRRDTIIIAVLVNGGLLAILFLMARHVESDSPEVNSNLRSSSVFESDYQIATPSPSSQELPKTIPASKEEPIRDEVDYVIQQFEEKSKEEPVEVQEVEADFIEVTVKRGDFLEKIANSNGTTVSAIKKANNLSNDRLDIGQVLKIPKSLLGTSTEAQKTETSSAEVAKAVTPTVDVVEEWYVVEKGDNPWKIAKKFNVRFDKLLELNNLNEEKARNLRAGDRLRVH